MTVTGTIWRQILWRNSAFSLLMIGSVWGVYIAGLMGIEMRSRGAEIVDALPRPNKLEREIPHDVHLNMALVVSLVVGVFYCRRINRARVLAKRGVAVPATLRRLGGIADFRPLRRGEFTYSFGGKSYRWKSWAVEKLPLQSTVALVVDPIKPSRAMFRGDVFPRGHIMASTESEPLG